MTQLAVFLLIAFGVTYVITESVIFVPFRLWIAERAVLLKVLVYCAYCTGFWVGAALAPLLLDGSLRGWGGPLVMGGVAVMRAFGPFLEGAYEREQRRDPGRDDATSHGYQSGADRSAQ